tara:strand:+ start:296 stop:520 length:225 start_codon:yes stop_codon:yes gene_type:complete
MSNEIVILFGVFLVISLWYTWRRSEKSGYQEGIVDTLGAVEEALGYDQKKMRELLLLMGENEEIKLVKIESDSE